MLDSSYVSNATQRAGLQAEATQPNAAQLLADENACIVDGAQSVCDEKRTLTLSFKVAYNGAPFSGFARQPKTLTVQGELEHALELLFRRSVETTCAGRTDAGVHSRGQVVSFLIDKDELRGRSFDSLARSLNALTHEAISVRDVRKRPCDFSARFSAQKREYRYFICTQASSPIFLKDFSWYLPKQLDVAAMKEAAAFLIGEHDFKSFCLAASAEGKPTCRNVMDISFSNEVIMGESALCITVVGNAFLHSMVRTIVGSLVAVGLGKRKPQWMDDVLKAKDRRAAGQTAPACGLVFWEVFYDEETN